MFNEKDYKYKARVGKLWLQGCGKEVDLTADPEEATEYESKTEPTQIFNQMKKDKKVKKNKELTIEKFNESITMTVGDYCKMNNIKDKELFLSLCKKKADYNHFQMYTSSDLDFFQRVDKDYQTETSKLNESVKVIKTPYGKMQVVDEFVIQDDDKLNKDTKVSFKEAISALTNPFRVNPVSAIAGANISDKNQKKDDKNKQKPKLDFAAILQQETDKLKK